MGSVLADDQERHLINYVSETCRDTSKINNITINNIQQKDGAIKALHENVYIDINYDIYGF